MMGEDIVRSLWRHRVIQIYVSTHNYMNSKPLNEYKKTLSLTKRQRDILVGLLLGDGHLETQNNGKTYRLKVEHGLLQTEYTEWLYEAFKDWVLGKPKLKKRNGIPESIWFQTVSHGSLRFYGHQFYDLTNRKKIPKIIHKLLTPESLAVWYMDDGSKKSNKHKTHNIHTLGFTKDDLDRVQKALLEKFELQTTLHKQKDNHWRIYIPKDSTKKFLEIIDPYIIPSMRYKL